MGIQAAVEDLAVLEGARWGFRRILTHATPRKKAISDRSPRVVATNQRKRETTEQTENHGRHGRRFGLAGSKSPFRAFRDFPSVPLFLFSLAIAPWQPSRN
jgi:hypothetical protein